MQVTQRRLEQYGKLKGRYRRLRTPRRKPEILRLLARWLSRPGGVFVCRQSRHWFFGQGLGKSLCEVFKNSGHRLVRFLKSAGKKPRHMGPRYYFVGHETLPLGRTRAGRPNQVYCVDQRRPAASTRLSRPAKRQELKGGGSRIGRRSPVVK